MPERVVAERAPESQPNSGVLEKLGYLSDEQVCAALGWTRKTLQNRRSAGAAPPSSKVGQRDVTDVADFKAWVRRHRRVTA